MSTAVNNTLKELHRHKKELKIKNTKKLKNITHHCKINTKLKIENVYK